MEHRHFPCSLTANHEVRQEETLLSLGHNWNKYPLPTADLSPGSQGRSCGLGADAPTLG